MVQKENQPLCQPFPKLISERYIRNRSRDGYEYSTPSTRRNNRRRIALADNSEITTQELMEIIPGPDFPTSRIIILGRSGIGRHMKLEKWFSHHRGKVEIEEKPNGKQKSLLAKSLTK